MKIIKYLMLMCLALYSGNRIEAQTHWTCDEKSFEYDMSAFLTISNGGIVVDNLSNYEIAAFVGSECRGVSKYEENDGYQYLYLRIRSNKVKGETISFKCYDKSSRLETIIDNTFNFENKLAKGYPSTPFELNMVNNVMVNVIASEGGKVEGGGAYTIGSTATIKAIANNGWHFVKWSDGNKNSVYSFKVTGSINLKAIFARNVYNITFYAFDGSTIVKQEKLEYEAVITAPIAPVREGHTFSTWGNVPAKMPAHDLTFTAQYAVNKYHVKFIAEGVTVYDAYLNYGTEIITPKAPAKKGFTFKSWGNVPKTVPAHDVTFYAQYTINKYKLQFVAEGVLVYEEMLEYGAEIKNIPEAPTKEGYLFLTWGDIPKTMPAHDLKFEAQYTTDYMALKNGSASIGSQVTLPVEMSNVQQIVGFQFDMHLPEGITVAKDAEGFDMIEISNDRSSVKKHSVTSGIQTDGSVRVLCYSNANYIFSGNSGNVLNITFNIDSNMTEGIHTIKLKNVVMTNAYAQRIDAPETSSTIELSSFMLGDVNSDEKIDVSDIAGIVAIIINSDNNNIFNKAADINMDNQIDVSDIAGLVSIIMK